MYTREPDDKRRFTQEYDKIYTQIARIYDLFVKGLPFWRQWITQAVPAIRGPRVLEVSFGTGYLLTKYANSYHTYGVDLNWDMARTAQHNLAIKQVWAAIQQADVQNLPFQSGAFDSVVSTMAFTGFPDGQKAMSEIKRVLRSGGRLILVDINYPKDQNLIGVNLVKGWAILGDIIRDMEALLSQFEFQYSDYEVGGFGSVHLYVATKS